jgi:osmotically-inducible protein OsmY
MKTSLALALVCSLAACTAQQQRTTSNGANDAYLVTAVGAKLASIDVDAVTRVHVAASRGVVTLSGAAHSAAERDRYVDAAKSVNGVNSVRDDITIDPHAEGLRGQAGDAALTARISAAIAGQAGVNAFHVEPSVHQGNVTLKGTVPSQSVHETILQTVRSVPRVKGVVDDITVKR